MNINKLFRPVALAAVILIAVLFLLHGLKVGKARALASRVITDAGSVRRALDYFYADQERYPSALEFTNNESLSLYLTPFPPTSFVSGSCPKSMSYDQSDALSYRLYICIPAAAQGYAEGWNLFASKP